MHLFIHNYSVVYLLIVDTPARAYRQDMREVLDMRDWRVY